MRGAFKLFRKKSLKLTDKEKERIIARAPDSLPSPLSPALSGTSPLEPRSSNTSSNTNSTSGPPTPTSPDLDVSRFTMRSRKEDRCDADLHVTGYKRIDSFHDEEREREGADRSSSTELKREEENEQEIKARRRASRFKEDISSMDLGFDERVALAVSNIQQDLEKLRENGPPRPWHMRSKSMPDDIRPFSYPTAPMSTFFLNG